MDRVIYSFKGQQYFYQTNMNENKSETNLWVIFITIQDYSVLYNNAVCPVICEDWHFSVLYNNAVCPVICEGWHFTHMWTALKRGIIGPIKLV
jgi:hypothetical protein